MKLRQYCLVGIATSLMVAMTAQVGLAFSFTLPSRSSLPCDPFSSFYCSKHSLTLPGADGGTVTTKLKEVSSLTLGGTDAFFNLLTKSVWAKKGWQFQRATTDLAGIFNIGVYNAYATLETVGADIQILYNPVGQDPTGSNVHWIQRVVNNHGYTITLSGRIDLGHGIRENKIDVPQEQTQLNLVDPQNPQKPTFNPFYDTYGEANQIFFRDPPGREDIGENHNWSAELYLVQETAPKTVTIYNGIKWGWSNTFTPPPPPPPCNGSSGGGGCRTALASNIQVQNQALSDIEISKSSPTPVKVPEPIPALGLLALGVWGTFQGLKIINWRIDYTATMGQLIQDNVLVSSIFQGHQPIGLYSHRGHAAFVLVVASVLILVCRNWGWLSVKVTAVMIIPVILALLLTQTRAGIIAVMIAIAYFLYQSSTAKRYRRIAICTVLVSLLLVSTVSASRHIQALNQLNFDRKTLLLKNLTSDRAWLWELGLQGIRKRPLLGWGFDGFGIAYSYVLNPHHIPKVIYIDNFSYDYLSQDGELATELLPTYKAHNLILDTTVSIGILGLLTYLALLGSYVFHLIKSPYQGIEAVVIAYLVFTFTWFDCGQFTHLSWWTLSLADINSKQKQKF